MAEGPRLPHAVRVQTDTPAGWGRALAVALGAAAFGAALSVSIDRGLGWGLAPDAIEYAGYAFFAFLVAAPLAVYPCARALGAATAPAVAASLLPGLHWWLGEVWLRWQSHSLPEAVWLALSPFNTLHFALVAFATALADLGWSLARRRRDGSRPILSRRRVLALGGTGLVLPVLALGSIPFFLEGYRALFQQDLLPAPGVLPGPLPAAAPEAARAERPNVVFILSDDHRYDVAGFAGHPFVRTPSLDRLAAEGVVFERAFVTSSLCSPSRASFLTGTTPHRHGVFNNFTPWSDDNRTFLEYLGRAGYRTALIGKWHMPGGLPDLRGVDHVVTFTNLGGQGSYEDCPLLVDGREEPSRKRYLAEELTDRAIAWLETNARADAPFALYLAHKNVHAPFTPDAPERGSYAGLPVSLPASAHPWTHMTRAQYTHFHPQPLGAAIRRYGEAVTSMDRQIGRLLDTLDTLGVADRTLVLYTSDNGYLWGEHGLTDKRWAWEESIRVPFVLRYPGRAEGGGRRRALVLNLDVAPTLLDAAGLPPADRMQGRSLLPLLRDPDAPWRDAFYYAYWFEPPYPTPTLHAVRTQRHKYVESSAGPPELYDLAADPEERVDLLASGPPPEVADALRRRLAELRARAEREP